MSDISQTGPHGPKSPSEDAPAMAEASTLSSPEIYEVIRRDGEEELARPSSSLFWSGLAAGALMSLSVLGESILHHHLPDTPSRVLVENFGYCLGFIVVILGRMQLFTENTITTVLPALAERSWRCLGCVARLWALVFGANLLGATLAAGFLQIPGVLTAGVLEAVRSVSQHAVALDPLTGFLRAIPSGIIIAALVWMIPRGQAS
ncbi:MAG: formate/nitrite transporter family protein, partial [Mangrovicoccus sp.]